MSDQAEPRRLTAVPAAEAGNTSAPSQGPAAQPHAARNVIRFPVREN
jgi:hypothetical protein